MPVAFPINIVTAIVSPTALPRPRMDAPTNPVLAIMIIPTVSAVSREIMKAVPQQQKEAAYMLGAIKWEMFKIAVFPYSKTGLVVPPNP